MPYDEAARVLSAWAGPSHAGLRQGEVLPLDQAQMTELLAETTARGNTRLEAALYAHADGVTRAIFGDDVYCERAGPHARAHGRSRPVGRPCSMQHPAPHARSAAGQAGCVPARWVALLSAASLHAGDHSWSLR